MSNSPINALAKLSSYIIGTLVLSTSNFFIVPFFTRTLSMGEIGIFSLLETFQQFLVVALGLGLPQSLLRWFNDEHYSYSQILSNTLLFQIIFSSILFFSFFLWNKHFTKFFLQSSPSDVTIIFLLL
ncbi:MAG: hypothetical protein RMJ53_02240, partial [Chitinophagales bacterium]|nr:hypothetical protein [Chitinophagales bacterium]